jgi:cold shock protein
VVRPDQGLRIRRRDEGGPDILLHANVLRNYGQSSVADGAGIELIAQTTPRGVQAVEVLRIDPLAGEPPERREGLGPSPNPWTCRSRSSRRG